MTAIFVCITVDFAVFFYFYHHFGGKGVYDGRTYAVQTAGYFVDAVAEFAAGVKYGVNNPDGRDSLGWMYVHRYTASVVGDGDTAVLLEHDVNTVTKAR